MSHIYTGIDVLHEYDFQVLKGRRVGLLTNPSAVNNKLERTLDVLRAGVTLVSLFAPEHGIHGVRRDGEHFASGYDEVLGVYVHSVYGTHIRPTREMLDGLDVIVCDIQDVGARFYTFLWTLSYVMDAAGEYGVPVFVLDRPNPLGDTIRGPLLHPECASLVGRFPIPIQHGMTIGELARLFNEHFGIGAKLEVVTMEGWHREQFYDETGLPWVLPSPNIPTLDSAIVYPGTVLFEGCNVSEGRGTTKPFELVGAPWVDPEPFAAGLNRLGLAGVHFRPALFEPTFHKHAKVPCGGCQIHITDRRTIHPVETGAALLQAFIRADRAAFEWRSPPYEYEYRLAPIDILAGSSALRERLDRDEDARSIAAGWAADVAPFLALRKPYLLY